MEKKNNQNLIQKYLGLAAQFIAAILIGVFLGKFLDKKFSSGKYLFTWILPMLFIFAILFSVVRDVFKDK
ncbi:AtpZ/AtpI family protein [Rhizosphaericola mali]|uniref:AtpZ/AtpI family protein n=1 Tax=Rhizosphaericola mali TaxID=2545455 RepID=UPI00177BA297|nr:AtpZ/AtpI family protein [Rhizosphaericola mali]